jgi:hypothetical protein
MMKKITFLFCLLMATIGHAQMTPIDFETTITTESFEDFSGGIATVIANPQSNGTNTSATVAQIVRDGGDIWAGSKILLADNLDFSTFNVMSMKVFTSAPVGTVVKFKLEGGGETEVDAVTTVSNEWETLTWDFTGAEVHFNTLVFMFDFGNTGDGSANSTFLFDDVEQIFGGAQIDWPVTFEGNGINYTTTDFGGNISSLVADPTNPSNTVVQAIKTDEAATWAGTTIGTGAGFATNLPFSLTDSKMYAKVWSPEAGTPIRLKVEDSSDPTHTCETETNTTLDGEWEVIEFDFVNQALGTESLSVGLSMGWTYNMASIFFNFGTEGATAGEKTYYFDNVSFGEILSNVEVLAITGLETFPNPTSSAWTISTDNQKMTSINIFDLQGKLMLSLQPESSLVSVNASNFTTGIYVARISTGEGIGSLKLVKK